MVHRRAGQSPPAARFSIVLHHELPVGRATVPNSAPRLGVTSSATTTAERDTFADVNIEEFKETLSDPNPPDVSPALVALGHDARGDWEKAHNVAQDVDDASGSWVHAYLHRKEGDLGNAGYWYRRAHRPVASDSLKEEWAWIVTELLGR